MITSLRVSVPIWADSYPFVFQSCFSLFFWFGFSFFFSCLLICCCCYVSELNFIPVLVIRSSLNTVPGFYLQHECGEILYTDEDIDIHFFALYWWQFSASLEKQSVCCWHSVIFKAFWLLGNLYGFQGGGGLFGQGLKVGGAHVCCRSSHFGESSSCWRHSYPSYLGQQL